MPDEFGLRAQTEARIGERVTLVARLADQHGTDRVLLQRSAVMTQVRDQAERPPTGSRDQGDSADHRRATVRIGIGQTGEKGGFDQFPGKRLGVIICRSDG